MTNLQKLRDEHSLIDLFIKLAEIPSPSLKEQKVAEAILNIFAVNNIKAEKDDYGNILAFIDATDGLETISPILLSAHMDVVGGSEEVVVRLSEDNKYLETDKTRTLGADDKAGVACIINAVLDIKNTNTPHGPIEITFTRDEETGMTGIRELDTSKVKSEYAIIIDGEYLGEVDVEGAGFTNIYVKANGGKGGHSGIDIGDKSRISAIKVITEIDSQIPQGVFHQNETGVITSINAGAIFGGSAGQFMNEVLKDTAEQKKMNSANICNTVVETSPLNIISSEAGISYSLRSSSPQKEDELLEVIKNIISKTTEKYAELINIELEINKHLKPFVKPDNDELIAIITKSADECGIKSKVSSFHAGAETHVLANEKVNAFGKQFKPLIIGAANLKSIHSKDEQIEVESFLKGKEWLVSIIKNIVAIKKS